MESMKEMEMLKKEQEEKNKSHLEDLSKIHDKIMKLVSFIPEYWNDKIRLFDFNVLYQDETHTETMKKLLEERNVERKEAQNEIISANRFLLIYLIFTLRLYFRQFHEATYNMIKSRSETTAITMAILNNVVAKGALEKGLFFVSAMIVITLQTRTASKRRLKP